MTNRKCIKVRGIKIMTLHFSLSSLATMQNTVCIVRLMSVIVIYLLYRYFVMGPATNLKVISSVNWYLQLLQCSDILLGGVTSDMTGFLIEYLFRFSLWHISLTRV